MSLTRSGDFATIYSFATFHLFLFGTFDGRNLFDWCYWTTLSLLITLTCLVHPALQNAKGIAVRLSIYCLFHIHSIAIAMDLPSEINSLGTSTTAIAGFTCTNWVSNFAFVIFTPIFIGKSCCWCYLLFALIDYL